MPPLAHASRRRALGRAIRDRRVAQGRTQEQFAEALGVPVRTLSGWEKGTREVPASLLLDIASLLQCRVTELLTGDD